VIVPRIVRLLLKAFCRDKETAVALADISVCDRCNVDLIPEKRSMAVQFQPLLFPFMTVSSVWRLWLVLVVTLVVSVSATAQDAQRETGSLVGLEPTRVMVLDQDYVVDRSVAIAALRPNLVRLAQIWEQDLEQRRLRLTEQLEVAKSLFETGDPNLVNVERDIQAEEQLLREEVDSRKRSLNDLQLRAVRLVRTQLALVARELAQQRGANMIISKGQGIWVPVEYDLTEQVLARLNETYVEITPLVAEIEAEIDLILPSSVQDQ